MIQSCHVTTPNHSSILVVCTQAINSNVSGLVVVENERTNETLKKPLSQNRSVIFTGLEPGVQYRVRAYDDASSSTAAYEQSLFLNGIMVKPSPSYHVSSTILSTGKQCNISVFQMLALIHVGTRLYSRSTVMLSNSVSPSMSPVVPTSTTGTVF